MMRLGSVTHAFDMDQRMVGLNFTVQGTTLTLTSPPNGNIAPPGYYLLFILNSSGVPSVAKFVQISTDPTNTPPTGMITSPSSDITVGVNDPVSFAGMGQPTQAQLPRIPGYSLAERHLLATLPYLESLHFLPRALLGRRLPLPTVSA